MFNIHRELSLMKLDIISQRKNIHSLNNYINELKMENVHIKKENKKINTNLREIKTNNIVFQDLSNQLRKNCKYQRERLETNLGIITNDTEISDIITVQEFMKQR